MECQVHFDMQSLKFFQSSTVFFSDDLLFNSRSGGYLLQGGVSAVSILRISSCLANRATGHLYLHSRSL